MTDDLWTALYGLGGVIAFAAFCWVFIRYERGRRRAEEAMSPQQRKQAEVFRRGVFRRR